MKHKLYFRSVVALLMLWACDTNDTYKEFLRDGETIYVAMADSVRISPGRNRLKLSFLVSDPTTSRALILWNNKTDSLELPVQRVYQTDTVSAQLSGLKEGSYSFDIYTYDDEGNSSVAVNAVGIVYGDNYLNSLLETPVKGAYVNEEEQSRVDISWGVADETAIGSEVIYTDSSNASHTLFVPSAERSTVLTDHLRGSSFQYRTLYLPEETAIDTFYTAFKTAVVKGVATSYSKAGWVASGNDYDTGNPRPPKNAIDNNAATVWHMNKSLSYPHSMSIDMGALLPVSGFSFIQRTPLDGAAKVTEIKISTDGIEWNTVGEFTLENTEGEQLTELSVDVTCRYFEVIVKSDYKNGQFTALAEIGAYRREQFSGE